MKELQVKGAADGKLSIALNGDIDSGNADEFYAETMAAYKENPADIVFECGELN